MAAVRVRVVVAELKVTTVLVVATLEVVVEAVLLNINDNLKNLVLY